MSEGVIGSEGGGGRLINVGVDILQPSRSIGSDYIFGLKIGVVFSLFSTGRIQGQALEVQGAFHGYASKCKSLGAVLSFSYLGCSNLGSKHMTCNQEAI